MKNIILYKNKSSQKAFTLVELIIVITILAILATIAFVSFQNYTKDSRDGNRLATVTNIEKGMNLFQIKSGSYPLPEDIYASGYINSNEIIFEVGYVKENISKSINFSKTPTDPVSGENYYVYGVSHDKKYYQIATTLENLQTNLIIPTTYANSHQAYVIGNYKGVLQKGDTLVNPASLILAEKGAKSLTGSTHYFVENKGQNLPYKINTTTTLTGGTAKETTSTGINALKKDWNIHSGSIQSSLGVSPDIVGVMIFGEKEYFSSVKDGGSSGGTSAEKPIDGACGTSAINYAYNSPKPENWETNLCSVGEVDGETTEFPTYGNDTTWLCSGVYGGNQSQECRAKILDPETELKQCSGNIANSVYFNGEITYSVPVNIGDNPPTAKYETTPIENSCDFRCVDGFHTENNGKTCISNTKTMLCSGKEPTDFTSFKGSIARSITWNKELNKRNTADWSHSSEKISMYPPACTYKCKAGYYYSDSENTCVEVEAGYYTDTFGNINTDKKECSNGTISLSGSFMCYNVQETTTGTYEDLCSTKGEIFYTNSSGNYISQVDFAGRTLAGNSENLNCSGYIVVCSGNKAGYTLRSCNEGVNTSLNFSSWILKEGYQSNEKNTVFRGNYYQFGKTINDWDDPIEGTGDWKDGINGSALDWGANNELGGSYNQTQLWINSTMEERQKMKGPCTVDDTHIPTNGEWINIIDSWRGGISSVKNGGSLKNALKLPYTSYKWERDQTDFSNNLGHYYTSTPGDNGYGNGTHLLFREYNIEMESRDNRYNAMVIRCIRD